jgi:hypothetical protein
MAKKANKSSAANLFNEEIRGEITQKIDELLEKHGRELSDAIEESEEHKLPVRFTVDVDCSDSAPAITIGMRATVGTLIDSRVIHCTDPNQTEFRGLSAAELRAADKEEAEAGNAMAPKRSRKKKDKEPTGPTLSVEGEA